ncbi:hypothetical protein BgiBS90_007420 [Biomphalaria glabrata]|nr:hypothetical protein BgiBS90_007420 [Biomphalaria glabrata]
MKQVHGDRQRRGEGRRVKDLPANKRATLSGELESESAELLRCVPPEAPDTIKDPGFPDLKFPRILVLALDDWPQLLGHRWILWCLQNNG